METVDTRSRKQKFEDWKFNTKTKLHDAGQRFSKWTVDHAQEEDKNMTTFQEIINNIIDECENPANRVITGCLVGSKNVYITSNCDGWAEDQAKPLMSFDVKTSLEPCDFIGLTEADAIQMIIFNDLLVDVDIPLVEEDIPF